MVYVDVGSEGVTLLPPITIQVYWVYTGDSIVLVAGSVFSNLVDYEVQVETGFIGCGLTT